MTSTRPPGPGAPTDLAVGYDCTHPDCRRVTNLLTVADGSRYCPRHLSDDDRALRSDLARRAARVNVGGSPHGTTGGAWPYGPNISLPSRAALLDWAEPLGLRYSPRARCLHWIARGRCAVQECCAGRWHHRWMDHASGWTRDGRPAVLAAQPYGVTSDDLARVAADLSLDVRVGHRPLDVATPAMTNADPQRTGWYGHGTTFIEIRRMA